MHAVCIIMQIYRNTAYHSCNMMFMGTSVTMYVVILRNPVHALNSVMFIQNIFLAELCVMQEVV
jgi:hypothetical protein